MKRKLVILLISLVTVAVVVQYVPRARGATTGSLPELLELAPGDSTMVAYFDLAAMRDSPLLQRLAAMAPAANQDRDYADFVRATGFDYQRDLDHVVFISRGGQTMALAEGRFNREKIEQYALRSGRLDHDAGRPVYRVPSATPGKNVSLAFLTDDRLALSDGGDLSAVLKKSQGSLSPEMRERLSRVSGTPVFAVMKIPATTAAGSTAGSMGGVTANPLATPFRSVRWVGLAARPDGNDVYLSAEGECDSPEQANSVAAGLELLRGVLRSALSAPQQRSQISADQAAAVNQVLGNISVTTDAARVRLLLTLTPEMLRLSSPTPAVGSPTTR